MLINITSTANEKVKYACSLKQANNRKKEFKFLCEGRKTIELALASGCVCDIFTTEEINNLPSSVNQYLCSESVIAKISSTKNPEGIIAVCNYLPKPEFKNYKKIVYLDHVNDPGNMGTIIRTALAFDYDCVMISPDSCSIYNEKVVASTKGAMFHIPLFENADLADFKGKSDIIVSTLSPKSVELSELTKPENFVLVLGNEAHGISKETSELADISVKIPIKNIDSLNVGIAAGILMYHLK